MQNLMWPKKLEKKKILGVTKQALRQVSPQSNSS